MYEGGYLDQWDIECVHEQLFYQDGKDDANKGYFRDSKIKTEDANVLNNVEYIQTCGGFDDCVMRIAVEKVKPKPYSLLKYNCQDWAAEVRAMYHHIKNDPEVKKKCCKKRK